MKKWLAIRHSLLRSYRFYPGLMSVKTGILPVFFAVSCPCRLYAQDVFKFFSMKERAFFWQGRSPPRKPGCSGTTD